MAYFKIQSHTFHGETVENHKKTEGKQRFDTRIFFKYKTSANNYTTVFSPL